MQSGQLELLSGGFYEPILSSLPEEDAIGQIRMMNAFLESEFGCRPQGLWLTERIWSPHLPKIIAKAGIRYTIVDDTHFYYAGLEERQMHGYYMTETEGFSVGVFPISKTPALFHSIWSAGGGSWNICAVIGKNGVLTR